MAVQSTMTDERKAILEAAGINVDEALQRFMNKEQLWIKFLKKFQADTSYADLLRAVEAGDCDKAFEAAHTLKGITGNLALTKLNGLVGEQTEYLRGANRSLEEAAAMMPKVTEAYENTRKIIDEVYGE